MEPPTVCRACLTTISLEYIDLESPLYDDVTFLDCFNYCTKLQATSDDELPINICVPCGRSLQITYDFLKVTLNADKTLRDSLVLFGDHKHVNESSATANNVNSSSVKKENDFESIEYKTEYVEEFTTLYTDQIKVENKELPKFEVVISDRKGEGDNSDAWLSADEETSYWPILRLEDHNDTTSKVDVDNFEISEEENTRNRNIGNERESSECKEKIRLAQTHGKYICGWCGELFNCRSKLCTHKLIDHNGEVPTTCLTCGENFSEETTLRSHVKKRHTPARKPVVCPYCKKEFKALALHIKSNHPDILRLALPEDGNAILSRNQCNYCFRHFPSKNILNDHLNTHTGERPYSCSSCDKKFHKKTIRDRHELMVHQSKDMPKEKCDLCDFSTSNIYSLRSHKFRHRRPIEKKYLCAFCPMTFINPKKLYMHEDFKHGNAEKAFKCDTCNKKFSVKRKLKDHQLCVHVDGRPFKCSQCEKSFKNDFQLKAHEKLHNGKAISCSQCDKKFARQVDLRIHMRTHTGELPYECHLCDKRYAIKVRLTYHLQKHMGVKHKCQQCPSEFNSRSKLRLHMFKHIGMPYVCDHCEMGYPNRVGLRRHSKSAHKIILTAEDLLENRRKNEKKIFSTFVRSPSSLNPLISSVESQMEK